MGLPLARVSESDGDTFREEGSIKVLLDATLPGEVGGVFSAANKDWKRSPPVDSTYLRGFWSTVVSAAGSGELDSSCSCVGSVDSWFIGSSMTVPDALGGF